MSQLGQLLTSQDIGAIDTLTGNSGGPVGPDGASNINIIGAGDITVTGNPGTNTLTISSTGNVPWTNVSGTSAAMAVNQGYIANNAGLVTLTLPAVAAQGSVIRVAGQGAGGWTIAQNAGQLINDGSSPTTTGVTGSLSSTNRFDAVELLCTVTNTTFNVLSSQGNLTIA